MKLSKIFCSLLVYSFFHGICLPLFAQEKASAKISIDLNQPVQKISPLMYGQFIEYLGRCIGGGIYDKNSLLSDENGFRKDVLQRVKAMDVPLLRFPGGTVIKIYHWQDGIGPKETRPKRKNLIWGGVNDNQFGTDEFVDYCRQIGAEPFLVINMSTGTPEEASNWVEYCNGTGDTYWANLRRAHGYEKPFNVKYWGIGNEEYAATDAGKHQNVEKYIEDCWQFVKLMKLQDSNLKLTLVGNSTDKIWTERVLKEMHPVCDFISIHLYSIPSDSKFETLLKSIDAFETDFDTMRSLLKNVPEKVENFSSWYRFPPRSEPVKVAVDEWGIWDLNSGKGKGDYQMEYTYNWGHALAVGKFLNLFQRNADLIGLATWAQTVNVLAPIMTKADDSFCQTIYTPLKAYRQYMLPNNLKLTINQSGQTDLDSKIDATAGISDDGKEIVLAVLNLSDKETFLISVDFTSLVKNKRVEFTEQMQYTAPGLESENDFGKNIVSGENIKPIQKQKVSNTYMLKAASINFFRFKVL